MLNSIVIFLQLCGVLFFLGACVGILRMPDFYSRMHAASKGDTLSSLCLLGGFIIYIFSDLDHHSSLTAIK
ncbi:MAG: monovalent cation/H(+) antiporter subunit G, partial [Romboutsia sp.]|nr:monovalent cation/H(+) antiporter subunit G [Romboutsia sp.]